LAFYRGDPPAALRHAREALSTAERLGALGYRAGARSALGAAHLMARRFDEAIAALEDAVAIASPDVQGLTNWSTLLARLAEAHLGRGDLEAALALSADAVAAAAASRRLAAADAFLARARVLLATDGDRKEVERVLGAAAEIAARCGAAVYEAPIHEERAHLAERSGNAEDRTRELDEALRRYREIGAAGHVQRFTSEAPVGRAANHSVEA
jgi:tetratricopeptide (TPR) repeat protein